MLAAFPIEHKMSSNVIFPVTLPDIVAHGSDTGLVRDRFKTGIKHGQIPISLITPPFFFSKSTYGFQVLYSFGCEAK